MLPYRQRGAGAVIHTHSPNAVMATLLWPGKEFRCTYLEMIKVGKLISHKYNSRNYIFCVVLLFRAFMIISWVDICVTMKSLWFQLLRILHSKKI